MLFTEQLFDGFSRSVEFLIAFGSMIGILGMMIGFMMLLISGRRFRHTGVGVLVVSILLVSLCGMDTGLRYFRIF